jgi:hypothetical protein
MSKEIINKLRKEFKAIPKQICQDCQKEIWHESSDEEDIILPDGTIICKVCYWSRVGEEFAKHPIVGSKKIWIE